MRKKILSAVMVLAMLLSLLPVTALAVEGDTYVAEVWENTQPVGESKKYSTIEEAIESINGTDAYIRLLQDIPVDLTWDQHSATYYGLRLEVEKDTLTLDLGGHTLTAVWPEKIVASEENGAFCAAVSVSGNSQDEFSITNGTIVLSKVQGSAEPNVIWNFAILGEDFPNMNLDSIEIQQKDPSEGGSILAAVSSLSRNNGYFDFAFENCVIKLGENTPPAISLVGLLGYESTEMAEIVSGDYQGLDYDGKGKATKYNKEDVIKVDGVNSTVITSEDTTAIIVDDGNAYLYDTLQEAVNAVEPDGTIQLLRQPGDQSVTVPIHAKFCVIGFGDADVDVSADLFATEEGYQVIVDKDGWVYVEEADIPVTDISLNRTWLTLTKGETAGLTATVSPSNATDKDVTWISSDTAIATVADGTVTAVAPGTATITATAGGKSATCTVTVTAAQQPSTPSTSDRDDDDDGYSISVPASSSIRGGSITVSPRRADRDDSVTITVTPDDGYVLDELSVTTRGGDAVSLRQRNDSQYTFEMPAGSVVIHVSFMEQSSTPAEEMFFSDVPSDFWAYNEIQWAFENGYMNGTTSTTFVPGGAVTRQQVWMILARMAGSNPVDMAAARAWAVNNGISDGTNPGGAVTRQQLVALLHRFAAQNGYDTTARADLSGYPDVASVASYAADAMAWSVAEGIVGGTTQGTLNPAGTANRAQFAVILWRFYQTSAN